MKVRVKDGDGELLPAVQVDLAAPPPRIQPRPGRPAIGLVWDRAIDDEKHLRRCPVCGCPDLFRRKLFPQITGFAVVLLGAYAFLLILGHALQWAALVALIAVVAADIYFYLAGPIKLVCYRCGSEFTRVRPGENHRRWDSAVQERYRG